MIIDIRKDTASPENQLIPLNDWMHMKLSVTNLCIIFFKMIEITNVFGQLCQMCSNFMCIQFITCIESLLKIGFNTKPIAGLLFQLKNVKKLWIRIQLLITNSIQVGCNCMSKCAYALHPVLMLIAFAIKTYFIYFMSY